MKNFLQLRGTGRRDEKVFVCENDGFYLHQPAAICMYPARVQILLSHPPLGRKMVMMANRELTASRAQPPEHSTALVWNTDTQLFNFSSIHSLNVNWTQSWLTLSCKYSNLEANTRTIHVFLAGVILNGHTDDSSPQWQTLWVMVRSDLAVSQSILLTG